MQSFGGFFNDDARHKALLAASVLTLPNIQHHPKIAATRIRDLVAIANYTLRESHIPALMAAQRVVGYEILYRPPATPHLLQKFQHQADDYSLLLPLAPGQHINAPLLPVSKTGEVKEGDDIKSLLQLAQLRRVDTPDECLIVLPKFLSLIAHWLESIEGAIHGITYSVSRPGSRPNVKAASHFTIEGTA